jgi:hypothetical protein
MSISYSTYLKLVTGMLTGEFLNQDVEFIHRTQRKESKGLAPGFASSKLVNESADEAIDTVNVQSLVSRQDDPN